MNLEKTLFFHNEYSFKKNSMEEFTYYKKTSLFLVSVLYMYIYFNHISQNKTNRGSPTKQPMKILTFEFPPGPYTTRRTHDLTDAADSRRSEGDK